MSAERNALDRALARAGKSVTLRRRVGTTDTFVSVSCLAFEQGATPSELVGSVTQTGSRIIVSPTAFMGAAAWPGAAGGDTYPQKGDQFMIGGRPRTIADVDVVEIGDEAVRIEAQVRG